MCLPSVNAQSNSNVILWLKFNQWHILVTDGSILLLAWITDVLSEGARSHLLMSWSTKLHNLREQRTWEPKMLPLLSIKSLTKLPLLRAKSNFSCLLNLLLGCSCISLDLSLFLLSAAEGLFFLIPGFPVLFWTHLYCILHGFSLLSVGLPCSLLNDLWRSLTIPDHWTTSGHPYCSDFWPQLHLGQGIGFSSALEAPHSAAISTSTLVILTTQLQKPEQLKWVKTSEQRNERHLE